MNKPPTNYTKHISTNGFQRLLINRFLDCLYRIICDIPLSKGTLLDVGCGEGFVLQYLSDKRVLYRLQGIEVSQESIALGSKLFPKLHISQGDIYDLHVPDHSIDIVLCSEVLEHLEKPEQAIKELVRITKSYIVVSVPHEPWFMLANLLRGKYVSHFGNHPEHINHWTRRSLVQFLRNNGIVIVSVSHPFPWTLVVGKIMK